MLYWGIKPKFVCQASATLVLLSGPDFLQVISNSILRDWGGLQRHQVAVDERRLGARSPAVSQAGWDREMQAAGPRVPPYGLETSAAAGHGPGAHLVSVPLSFSSVESVPLHVCKRGSPSTVPLSVYDLEHAAQSSHGPVLGAYMQNLHAMLWGFFDSCQFKK